MGKEWALAPLRALTCPSLAKELGGFCFFVFLFCFLTFPVLCPFIRGNKIQLQR